MNAMKIYNFDIMIYYLKNDKIFQKNKTKIISKFAKI